MGYEFLTVGEEGKFELSTCIGEEGDTTGARFAQSLAFSLSVFRKYHEGHCI